MNKQLIQWACIVLSLIFIPDVLSNEGVNNQKNNVINAKVIERKKIKYPLNAAKNGQEGWVIINFVINEEGRVIDPFIQESSGIREFEKESLKSIKKWQYKPATRNGQPIEQSNLTVKFDFNINGVIGVSGKFHRRYTSLIKAIKKNDLTKAKGKLDKLYNNKFWNYTESSFYWLADATYAKAIKDARRELISIKKALAVENVQINQTSISYLLFRQFILNLNNTNFAEAVHSFEQLKEKSNDQKLITQLQPHFDRVISLIEGNEPLVRFASLNSKGQLFHDLSRSNFSVAVDKGNLLSIEIRCDNKRSIYDYKPDRVWKIPEQWGECKTIFSGDKGTDIDIIELRTIDIN